METSFEVSPWLVELRAECCFPSSVTGPVEFFALARLAVICAVVAIVFRPFMKKPVHKGTGIREVG